MKFETYSATRSHGHGRGGYPNSYRDHHQASHHSKRKISRTPHASHPHRSHHYVKKEKDPRHDGYRHHSVRRPAHIRPSTPERKRPKTNVTIEALRDFCIDFLKDYTTEWASYQTLQKAVKEKLGVADLTSISSGMTLERFFRKYPETFSFDPKIMEVKLKTKTNRKRSLTDANESERKRQKRSHSAGRSESKSRHRNTKPNLPLKTYCVKSYCEIYRTKECKGEIVYVLSVGDILEAYIDPHSQSTIVQIASPEEGWCKKLDAVPLIVSGQPVEVSGVQKMRERQLRQLLLEGEIIDVKKSYIDITGSWCTDLARRDGIFFLTQEGKDVSGYLDSDDTCLIYGDLEGNQLNFTQKFLQNSMHGVGTVAKVNATLDMEGVTMLMNFSCVKPGLEEPITGQTEVLKRPTGTLTGRWSVIGTIKGGIMELKHYQCGRLKGEIEGKSCELYGWVDENEIRCTQSWLKGKKKGEVAQLWGTILDDDCIEISYALKGKRGNLKTGTNRMKRVKLSASGENIDELPEIFDGKAEFCPQDIDDKWHKDQFDGSVYKRMRGWKFFPGDHGIGVHSLYHPEMSICVLGEADFSFTCGFARRFNEISPGSCTNLVGTSYMLKQGYGPQLKPNQMNYDPKKRQFLNEQTGVTWVLTELVYHQGAHVRFGIDARNLKTTLRTGQNMIEAQVLPKKFDRLIFPFPRSSLRKFSKTQDTDLISGTFRACQQELAPDGELHLILHTSKAGLAQFDLWGVREIAEANGMVWRAVLPFDWHCIPPYHPKDVTGQNWNPFEPLIYVFTPKQRKQTDFWKWKVENRNWRPHETQEVLLLKNLINMPERGQYTKVSDYQKRLHDTLI